MVLFLSCKIWNPHILYFRIRSGIFLKPHSLLLFPNQHFVKEHQRHHFFKLKVFCSTSLPLTSTRWEWSCTVHFHSKQCAVDKSWQHRLFLWGKNLLEKFCITALFGFITVCKKLPRMACNDNFKRPFLCNTDLVTSRFWWMLLRSCSMACGCT